MRKLIPFLLSLLLLAGCAAPAESEASYRQVSMDEAIASEKLVRLGYTNIVEFGGINDWPGETVSGNE